MATINPFDFFVDEYAGDCPFKYDAELKAELTPYLKASEPGPLLAGDIRGLKLEGKTSLDFIWALNQQLQRDIGYLIRLEPGVQTPEETLKSGQRLVPRFGLAAGADRCGISASRRASCRGYLIQLKADVKSLDGPSGHGNRFHRLCTPGPKSICRARAGSGSIRPPVCSPAKATFRWPARPTPQSAAPITGAVGRVREVAVPPSR